VKERITGQTSLLGIANKARVIQAITLVLLRKRVFTKGPGAGKSHAGICAGAVGATGSPTAINFFNGDRRNAEFLNNGDNRLNRLATPRYYEKVRLLPRTSRSAV